MGIGLTAKVLGQAFVGVIRNTGQGSWFGKGRMLGVHNPFGSIKGKAKDPYINLLTLARISRDRNYAARISDNLAARFEGTMPPEMLAEFRMEVIAVALCKAKIIHEGNRPLIPPIMEKIDSPAYLLFWAEGSIETDLMKQAVLDHPKTDRGTKLRLAQMDYVPAYEAIKDSLTEAELSNLVYEVCIGYKRNLLPLIARHPRVKAETFGKAIRELRHPHFGQGLIWDLVLPNLPPQVSAEVKQLLLDYAN